MKQELIYKELSYSINGALFDVQNELGRYCSEKQYGDLLEIKLKERNLNFEREKFLPESFEGEKSNRNRIDFIVNDSIIIELKVKRVIERADFYQVKRYLTAFNKRLGLIVNFREKFLQPKRVINSQFVD